MIYFAEGNSSDSMAHEFFFLQFAPMILTE
jgi:hypothetical protein